MTPKRTGVFPTVSAGRNGEAEARRKTAAMVPMIPRKQAFRRLNSATSRPAGSSSMKRMRPANSLTSRGVASFDLIRKTSGGPPFAGGAGAGGRGVLTGKTLADLIREKFGVRPTFYLLVALVLANLGNTVAEFAGWASAWEIFGVSKYLSVPVGAAVVGVLVGEGTYRE